MKPIISYLKDETLSFFAIFNALAYYFSNFLQQQVNQHTSSGLFVILFWAASIVLLYFIFFDKEPKPSKIWLVAFIAALIYWAYIWSAMECRSCSLV